MTVHQQLLLDTKHVQEERSAVTLNMLGSVHKRHRCDDTQTSAKRVWRSALVPLWASRHIGGSRQGHPRYTDALEGRPRVAHNTIRCASNVQNHHCTLTTDMVRNGCSSPISPATGSISEQHVDAAPTWRSRPSSRVSKGIGPSLLNNYTNCCASCEVTNRRNRWPMSCSSTVSSNFMSSCCFGCLLSIPWCIAVTHFSVEIGTSIDEFSADVLRALHLGIFQASILPALWLFVDFDLLDTGRKAKSQILKETLSRTRRMLSDLYSIYDKKLGDNESYARRKCVQQLDRQRR